MNWLDWLLSIIVVLSVITSFRKGLTREVVGLAATLVALVMGIWFYSVAGSFVEPYVSSKGLANFCGFLIIFFGVLLAGSAVNFTVGKLLKKGGLKWIDRLLGAAFGLVRGVIVSIALVLAIVAFGPAAKGEEVPQSVAGSRLAPYMIEAAHVLSWGAPREMKEAFSKRYEQAKKLWRDVRARVEERDRSKK
jgi:membrane protein required for colicin V production